MAQALALAQLTGPQLRLVECHGTGTALGDPIETGALKATLAQGHGWQGEILGFSLISVAFQWDFTGIFMGFFREWKSMGYDRISYRMSWDLLGFQQSTMGSSSMAGWDRCIAGNFMERNGQQTRLDYQGVCDLICSLWSCAKRLGNMYSPARNMSFCRVFKIGHLLTGDLFGSIMSFWERTSVFCMFFWCLTITFLLATSGCNDQGVPCRWCWPQSLGRLGFALKGPEIKGSPIGHTCWWVLFFFGWGGFPW